MYQTAILPVSLVGCEVADFQVVTEKVKAQDCLVEKYVEKFMVILVINK